MIKHAREIAVCIGMAALLLCPTSADAAPQFEAVQGIVAMEAESVPVVTGWTTTTIADPAKLKGRGSARYFTGGSSICSTSEATAKTFPAMKYSFRISDPGTYVVKMNMRKQAHCVTKPASGTGCHDGAGCTSFGIRAEGDTCDASINCWRTDISNDVYVLMTTASGTPVAWKGSTDTEIIKFYGGAEDSYAWSGNSSLDKFGKKHAPEWDLQAGDYVFEIRGRSNGLKLDRLIVFKKGVNESDAKASPETLFSGSTTPDAGAPTADVGTTPVDAGLPNPDAGVTPPTLRVTSFTLINADSDQPIGTFDPLLDGDTLNLAFLPSRNLNVRANVVGSAGSVVFALDGNATYATESAAPYALAGDTGGDYAAWTPSVGKHTLTATPFDAAGGKGTAGQAYSITFTVSDDAAAVDAGVPDGLFTPDTGGVTPGPDSGVTPGADSGVTPGADSGVTPGADSGGNGEQPRTAEGSCAVVGAQPLGGSLGLALLLLLGLACLRRWRR